MPMNQPHWCSPHDDCYSLELKLGLILCLDCREHFNDPVRGCNPIVTSHEEEAETLSISSKMFLPFHFMLIFIFMFISAFCRPCHLCSFIFYFPIKEGNRQIRSLLPYLLSTSDRDCPTQDSHLSLIQ